MKLEDQVVSLELSKRLKELGMKNGSHYHWIFDNGKWKITELEVNEGGKNYEWLIKRGEFTREKEEKMGIGIGLYYAVQKDTLAELGMTEQEYKEAMQSSYPAFTVAELGEMLPAGVFSGKKQTTEKVDPDSNLVEVFDCWNNGFGNGEFHEDTEADARAKMLIYLLENGLMELPIHK